MPRAIRFHETGGPAELRYGQRVRSWGDSVPTIRRTPEALAILGPRCFGIDEPFQAIESIA